MDNNFMIDKNRDGWNKLIESGKKFSNTILPEYGPFLKRNEEEINFFKNVVGSRVLDLGCGEGESLEYLYNKGASEIWGVDISSEQIEKAVIRFPNFKDRFIVSPMESSLLLPKNYFDYVMCIFSIGYCSDIFKLFSNVYELLNDNGEFIISWTHPFYYCLDMVDDNVVVDKSYFFEDSEVITKGPDKVEMVQKNLMISTIINEARKSGLYLDAMLEEETVFKDSVNGYKSTFWRSEKTENCPSTVIFKFKKIINK